MATTDPLPRRRKHRAHEQSTREGAERLVLGRRNWLFTWLDEGGERTAAILTILATCIAHDINPRAYLHVVSKLIVYGWPNAHLRDLLPDRILKKHPNLFIGDPLDLPEAPELALLLHRMLPPPR